MTTIKKFLALLACGISMECNAVDSIVHHDEHKITRRYGCIPDSAAHHHASLDRLKILGAGHIDKNHPNMMAMKYAPLPSTVDLTTGFPDPFDQGPLGACTSNALVGAAMFDLTKQGVLNPDMLSRLYLYWQERKIEGSVNSDYGASLSDGILAFQTKGVCKESLWPYNISTFKNTPSAAMNTDALTCKDLDISNTGLVAQDLDVIKVPLYQRNPVIVGIMVYSSFETDAVAKSGIVSMPKTNKETLLGGHAVVIVGYDDSQKAFLMRNSWGTGWGTKGASGVRGYFWLPYNYILSKTLTSDLWKIGKVSMPIQNQH